TKADPLLRGWFGRGRVRRREGWLAGGGRDRPVGAIELPVDHHRRGDRLRPDDGRDLIRFGGFASQVASRPRRRRSTDQAGGACPLAGGRTSMLDRIEVSSSTAPP